MPRKKRIEQYEHKGKTRVNNPEVGLVDAAVEPPEGKKTYAYDPHLDPSAAMGGKSRAHFVRSAELFRCMCMSGSIRARSLKRCDARMATERRCHCFLRVR